MGKKRRKKHRRMQINGKSNPSFIFAMRNLVCSLEEVQANCLGFTAYTKSLDVN